MIPPELTPPPDEPPFTATFARWKASHEWDTKPLESAMATWRRIKQRHDEKDGLFARRSINEWLATARRDANKALQAHFRQGGLYFDEFRIGLIQVPWRERLAEGWMIAVPMNYLWVANPEVFTQLHDVSPNQYGDLTTFARYVEFAYVAWYELHGITPAVCPMDPKTEHYLRTGE